MNFISKFFKQRELGKMQKEVVELLAENNNQLNDTILEKQVKINTIRCELDLPDKSEIIYEDGFAQ
ncbi:MAG: hypothetical protein IJH63_00495 [Methanobrevibacter sp.]|nr:hypothetical protein [Methanosphaera sp.]MBR0369182.1 hypothetical protein [Methanobrevibacter sp.]